jgi:hypothetical protein
VETTPEWIDLVTGSLHIVAVLFICCGIYLAVRETEVTQVPEEPAPPPKPLTQVSIVQVPGQ